MSEENREGKTLTVKIDNSNVTEIIKNNADMALELKQLREEKEQKQKEELRKLQEDKETGKGSIPNLNDMVHDSEGIKEFVDFPSMVDYLKAHDPEQYKKLFAKGIQALREFPQSFEYKDSWVSGTSAIHKALEKQNEKARGKKA